MPAGCQPKNRGILHPKMDGENHGKPYFLMDDLGGFPIIFGSTPTWTDKPSPRMLARGK